jgi:hypothetical protein
MKMGAATTQTIWGIHAGRTGDAHTLFLQKGVIAIGWEAMGDLSAIPAKRDAFKSYSTIQPGRSRTRMDRSCSKSPDGGGVLPEQAPVPEVGDEMRQ